MPTNQNLSQNQGTYSSHPIPWGEPLGETEWSIWVPSNTAELENYAGYIVPCSTWEAKFTHLFKEITTHHIKSVMCTMKWLEVQRQQFHSAANRWQFWGDKWAAISPLLWEREQTVRRDPNSSRGAHQGANSCFVSTKIGCTVLKGSNKVTPKHLGTG